jgi:hypothetical protein
MVNSIRFFVMLPRWSFFFNFNEYMYICTWTHTDIIQLMQCELWVGVEGYLQRDLAPLQVQYQFPFLQWVDGQRPWIFILFIIIILYLQWIIIIIICFVLHEHYTLFIQLKQVALSGLKQTDTHTPSNIQTRTCTFLELSRFVWRNTVVRWHHLHRLNHFPELSAELSLFFSEKNTLQWNIDQQRMKDKTWIRL